MGHEVFATSNGRRPEKTTGHAEPELPAPGIEDENTSAPDFGTFQCWCIRQSTLEAYIVMAGTQRLDHIQSVRFGIGMLRNKLS
ncbi:hypothetical protein DPMN_105578 [Dreissena polymorpha]|uniref:Uncharacterized protein n=1 Tax=Dreissena polymorpha TaxID=45954 RepID=A0A9D4K3G3_DREPO|nr:hypothetical protein DPMN_105578 [Dreissena polymorpha]